MLIRTDDLIDRFTRLAGALVVSCLLTATPSRAEVYNLTDLGSLGGVRGSGAYAFKSGFAAGYSFVQGSSFVHAMLNDHGTVRDLGTLGARRVWRAP